MNTVNGDCKSDFFTARQEFPLITKNLINQRKWDVLLKPIGWPLDCWNSVKNSDKKSSDRSKKSERTASSRARCTVCSDVTSHVVDGRS